MKQYEVRLIPKQEITVLRVIKKTDFQSPLNTLSMNA